MHRAPSSRAHEMKNPPSQAGFVFRQTAGPGGSEAQKRVRMPIVPTTWFAVLDAPPDVLMNAW